MRRPIAPNSPHTALRTLAAASLALLVFAQGCRRKAAENGQGGTTHVAAPNTAKYADTLSPLIASQKLPFLRWPSIPDYQPPLNAFYTSRQLELAWSRDGKPTAQAAALIQAFHDAAAKGLNPEDYDSSRWPDRLRALSSGDHQAVAEFDVAMTVDTMRYLSNLHLGRVAPQHFNFEIDAASKRLDWPKFLNDQILESSDIPAVLHSLEPDSDDYRKTLDALHHYQDLAQREGGSSQSPLVDPGRNLSPGDRYSSLYELERRLALEGDGDFTPCVPPGNSSTEPEGASGCTGLKLTAADSAAIKAYQARHGISPDGKLGPVTVKSLNVPMSVRVTQLEDALERWRWLPDPYNKPRLLVNLPEFMLHGYTPDHEEAFTMRVVVGKVKGDHETPVFAHMMKYLIFRPFWNVPISIIKKELVPHVEANPGYLEAKGYEVRGRSGKEITDYTAHALDHDGYLVRMKPGPSNALGLIKFMFPNQFDIYLHSTPEVGFFSRQRRDFSHGCIRVQHPDDLAVWVLNGQDDTKTHQPWDLDMVNQAMQQGDDNRQVSLKTQLPIVIFYLTAHVEADGKVDFFDDIYSYDQQLDDTLKQGPPYPTRPIPVKPTTPPGDTV